MEQRSPQALWHLWNPSGRNSDRNVSCGAMMGMKRVRRLISSEVWQVLGTELKQSFMAVFDLNTCWFIPLLTTVFIGFGGAHSRWQGRDRVYLEVRALVFMQISHTFIHPLSPQGKKTKHTPKLLLNTLIDGGTVCETEPHIRAITGQMIEHEVFFVTAD